MKDTYLIAKQLTAQPIMRLLLLLLLALPVLGQAQTFTVTPADPANPQNFGSVPVGSSSAAKSYVVSASGLTPNTGTVAVALSGTSYEISRDNSSFSGQAFELIADANGTISTTVYARFTPTGGIVPLTINRLLTFTSDEASGSDVSFNLTGTRVAGSPNISVSPVSLSFNQQPVNTASASQVVTLGATSLTGPITVTAPVGYEVSNSNVNGGAFASTITIPQGGGTVNTSVNVRFAPTTNGPSIGNVTFASAGATTRNVGVSGTGTLPTPVLNVVPGSLSFGTTSAGTPTASQFFTVSGSNLQGNVTVTAPAGYQIRTGTNFFSNNAITLTPTGGTLTATRIDVRFVPATAGTFSSNIVASTPNSNTGTPITTTVAVAGTATPSSGTAAVFVDPAALNFGTITSSGSTSTQVFEVSGTDLSAAILLSPSSPNIQIRNATIGGSFSSSPLSIFPSAGAVVPQVIEVRLVTLVPQGAFNQRIDITSGTAAPRQVSITANNISGATSDISVTSTNLFTFVTRPNTVSASQSFLVAATNLVQPLLVEPTGPSANFFEISVDNVTFTRSISFTPDGQGNVTQRPVFVRFVPGVNAVTVTSTIRNSSAPAPNFDVSVTGISEPTLRLSRSIGDFSNSQVKGTSSAPVPVVLEGFLLTGDVRVRFPNDASDPIRNPQQTPLFDFSLNGGTNYTTGQTDNAFNVITPDADGNFSQSMLVRFSPVRVGNAAQELQFRNPSFSQGQFFALGSGFGRAGGFSIAVQPTAQSTATIVRSLDRRSATITFNLANPPANTAFGANRLVIGSSTYLTRLPTALFPQDRQNFNPGTTDASGAYIYGTGTEIELPSTNTFAVFSGANSFFTVTNLDPDLEYNFYGFEFNNDGVLNAENYLTPNNEPQAPLPVELVSFTARLRGSAVTLNWATATETNNRGFEVQRSPNGRDFATISFKPGNGTTSTRSTYEDVDARPLTGVSYYRLKQIDIDGTFVYSPVAIVNNTGLTEARFFPNPTTGKLTVALPQTPTTETLRVRISDLTGRGLREQLLPVSGELDLSDLPNGTYIVTVGTGRQQVSRRVVKN